MVAEKEVLFALVYDDFYLKTDQCGDVKLVPKLKTAYFYCHQFAMS
jgi:hypothetical protein